MSNPGATAGACIRIDEIFVTADMTIASHTKERESFYKRDMFGGFDVNIPPHYRGIAVSGTQISDMTKNGVRGRYWFHCIPDVRNILILIKQQASCEITTAAHVAIDQFYLDEGVIERFRRLHTALKTQSEEHSLKLSVKGQELLRFAITQANQLEERIHRLGQFVVTFRYEVSMNLPFTPHHWVEANATSETLTALTYITAFKERFQSALFRTNPVVFARNWNSLTLPSRQQRLFFTALNSQIAVFLPAWNLVAAEWRAAEDKQTLDNLNEYLCQQAEFIRIELQAYVENHAMLSSR